MTPAEDLQFHLSYAALYHRDRLSWFDILHRAAMFCNVFFGTGAVASLLQNNRCVTVAASLLLAFVSAASLAFDFAGMARRHQDRRRAYHDLAAELELSERDDAAARAIRAKMIRTAGEDPHVYKAADALAYNAALKSLGLDLRDEFVVTARQRRLRHIRTYSGTTFTQRKHLERAAADDTISPAF